MVPDGVVGRPIYGTLSSQFFADGKVLEIRMRMLPAFFHFGKVWMKFISSRADTTCAVQYVV